MPHQRMQQKIETEGLHTEITSNTVAITTIQQELIMLGIASVVNGLFTFPSQIISTSTLALEIAKCMKLQGQNNLTGNITSNIDTYTFYGAKPSEITYLSGVNSGIQGQLNNITSNYILSTTATNLYQPIGNYSNEPIGGTPGSHTDPGLQKRPRL